jgi:hypothetical protein
MATLPSLRVDFNRADDDDVIWAFRKRASDPAGLELEQALRLYDYEGNQCLGYVVGLLKDKVEVRLEPSTWIDAKPVKVTPVVDLMEALKASVQKPSTGPYTTAIPLKRRVPA